MSEMKPGGNMKPVEAAQFGWDTKELKNEHFSLLSNCHFLGKLFGAISGAKLMHYGRMRAMSYLAIGGVVAFAMEEIIVFWVWCLADFLQGLVHSGFYIVLLRFLEETVPNKMLP